MECRVKMEVQNHFTIKKSCFPGLTACINERIGTFFGYFHSPPETIQMSFYYALKEFIISVQSAHKMPGTALETLMASSEATAFLTPWKTFWKTHYTLQFHYSLNDCDCVLQVD